MKAQRILTVLLVSLGLLLALGVCLKGNEQAAAQPLVVASEAVIPGVQTPCVSCSQEIAPLVEGAAAANGVSRFRERPGLTALGGRAWSRASISRTLPFGSVTLSETIAVRRAAASPEIGGPRGLMEAGDCFAQIAAKSSRAPPIPLLMEAGDCFAQIARNDVPLRDSCKRELRPAAWREMALPSVSVAATVTLLTEGFETSVPPPGWVEEDVVGTEGDWTRASATVNPPGGGAHGGAYLALFNSGIVSAGAETRLRTPNLDLSHAVGSYYVSFGSVQVGSTSRGWKLDTFALPR